MVKMLTKAIQLTLIVSTLLVHQLHGLNSSNPLHGLSVLSNLLQISPIWTFNTSNPNGVSSKCRNDVRIFQTGLERIELWAVEMADSSGKVPSGLLNGNIHFLGDFDQCLQINHPRGDGQIRGKYCRVNMHLDYHPQMEPVMNEIFTHHIFIQPFDSNMVFLPSTEAMSFGVCLPSSCTVKDLSFMLHSTMEPLNATELKAKIALKSYYCDEERPLNLLHSTRSTVAVVCFVVLLVLTAFGTYIDMKEKSRKIHQENGNYVKISGQKDGKNGSPTNIHRENGNYLKTDGQEDGEDGSPANIPEASLTKQLLLAFSIPANYETLTTEETPGPISYIHGIRFIFSLLILISHMNFHSLTQPMTNQKKAFTVFETLPSMILRSLLNLVDPFVVLSGFLTAYFAFERLKNGRGINIARMYLFRYLKFAPLLIVLVIIAGEFGDELVRGPFMLHVPRGFINNCRNSFWQNVFFVDNFSGFNEMCYPVAHQLFTDMQMYVMAPFLILAMWKIGLKRSMWLVTLLILGVEVSNLKMIWENRLTAVIFHGINLEQLSKGADLYYINPIRRLTPYLMGVALAYYLQMTTRRIQLSKAQLRFGWILAIISGLYCIFGIYDAYKPNYKFDRVQHAIYTSIHPVLWNGALCWAIFVLYTNHHPSASRVLGWRGFAFYSRICYAIYMLQMYLLFGLMGITGGAPVYVNGFMTFLMVVEAMVLVVVAIAITVLIIVPPLKIAWIFTEKPKVKDA